MSIKSSIKKLIPPFLLKWYHYGLAFLGAIVFGFPSKKLTVIGVTGTSGKSTTVDFITKILEEAGYKVASTSSVRFKIGNREWKNQLKMTMPGRLKIQQFLKEAVKAECQFAVLEVTSEGIKQFRHAHIDFDVAVFTNLSPEHIESHGGFEKYRQEKMKLFQTTPKIHIVNKDDEHADYFLNISAEKTISFGIKHQADVMAEKVSGGNFWVKNTEFQLHMLGKFNVYNALAAITVASSQDVSLDICKRALERIMDVPGRMEVVVHNPLVVVDYAHTPEQLEQVYQSLSNSIELDTKKSNLICVLGSCGGGRDKWKRPVLGTIAGKYCKEIIITNEDPYDEDPWAIMEQVASGVEGNKDDYHLILDRREAIKKALELASPHDTVIITGKGSEPWMCLKNGVKILWDDRAVVRENKKA